MSAKRDTAMIRALHTLVSEMGDTPIPISSLWLERIIRRAGVPHEVMDHECEREVDAYALMALCAIALERMEA